jgi:hypothetical protein
MEDGSLVLQGSATLNCVDVLCYYRIIHDQSSADYTFQTSFNGVSWTTHETVASANQAKWFFILGAGGAGTTVDWTAEFDDWALVASVADGYRETASWDTTEITSAYAGGEVVRNITVAYSGASSSAYIDSVSVVDVDDGEVLYEDGTNIISGSSKFYDLGSAYATETALIGHDFVVRVTLASAGNSSILITAVSLTTVRPAALVFVDDVVNIFWLIFFACILAAIFATAWYVKEWRGV